MYKYQENKGYALYKYEEDCGYGSLYGLFIELKSDVDSLIKSQEHIYLGEVCGKYSEIEIILDDTNITLISEDIEVLNLISNLNLEHGYNPIDIYKNNE